MLHQQIYDKTSTNKTYWKSYLHLFSYSYQKCVFVDFLIEYKGSLSSVEQWFLIWRRSSIFFKHVSLWCVLIYNSI